GKYTEESTTMLMDVSHVLGGGELAVGEVEEIRPPGQRAEQVPDGAMGAVGGGVAALDPVVDRHGAVGRDGEDVEALLVGGAVILVVAIGDRQAAPSSQGALVAEVLVVPMEGHGRGAVVQLIERDAEGADGVGRDVEGQGREVGVEEVVQGATDAIVIER